MGLFDFFKRLFGGKKALAGKGQSVEDAGFGLTIKRAGTVKKERRHGFRVATPGLKAQSPELGGVYPVKDLSVTGLALVIEKPHQKAGMLVTLNLGQAGRVLIKELKAKIVRHEEGIVGCAFFDVVQDQEDELGKIVLAGQKLMAARRQQPGGQAQPAAKPTAQPAPKPVAQAAAKPVPQPAAKPAPKPGAQPPPKPPVQPAPKPPVQPAPKPGAQPPPKPKK